MIFGQNEVIELALTAFWQVAMPFCLRSCLAKPNSPPTSAGFSALIKRVQFTPDLIPRYIGFRVLDETERAAGNSASCRPRVLPVC